MGASPGFLPGVMRRFMMPYSNALYGVSDWYRQLWAESLGKKVNRKGEVINVGPTPIKALGATDQHSQVQLYREGPNDKVFTFLQVDTFESDSIIPLAFEGVEAMEYLGRSKNGTLAGLLAAEKRATELALLVSQRPSLTVRFPEIKARTNVDLLEIYARFTLAQSERSLAEGRSLEDSQRLYYQAFLLGDGFRRRFKISRREEVMETAAIIYRILGIEFRGNPDGQIAIERCFFSRYYSPRVCALVSALDQGLLAGLSGGSRLTFSQRITEGQSCCRAYLGPGGGVR